MFVDGSLPAVVRLDDGGDDGAQHQYGGQAAVGHPVVSHPAGGQVKVCRLSRKKTDLYSHSPNIVQKIPKTFEMFALSLADKFNFLFKPGLKH